MDAARFAQFRLWLAENPRLFKLLKEQLCLLDRHLDAFSRFADINVVHLLHLFLDRWIGQCHARSALAAECFADVEPETRLVKYDAAAISRFIVTAALAATSDLLARPLLRLLLHKVVGVGLAEFVVQYHRPRSGQISRRSMLFVENVYRSPHDFI